MLRYGVTFLRKPQPAHRWLGSLALHPSSHQAAPRAAGAGGARMLLRRPREASLTRSYPLRALSTEKKEGGDDKMKGEGDDETKEIVLTPGEKVVVASRLGMWAGIAAFAAVCAYYIGKELIPT